MLVGLGLMFPVVAQAQTPREFFESAVEALNESGLVPGAEAPQRPATAPGPEAAPEPEPRPLDREALAEDTEDAEAEAVTDPEAENEAETEFENVEPDASGEETPLPLPRVRPDGAQTPVNVPDAGNPEPADIDDAPDSDEPEATPGRVYQAACPAVMSGLVEATIVAPIHENQCGLQSPLEVTAVIIAGKRVPLTQPATLNCAMAGELARWAARFDTYSEAIFNAGVESILTGTSYYCRPRNNVEGADISEHGFGNALDVVGFTLESGERISLPQDWGDDSEEAGAMELAHDTACGFFTTVLGPEANALHRDHLHLDLGCHGRTCTARLCE